MTELKYMTIKQIVTCGKYPFTLGQLRSLLLNKERNGIDVCLRKIGKRLYIRTDLFDQWIEQFTLETKQ